MPPMRETASLTSATVSLMIVTVSPTNATGRRHTRTDLDLLEPAWRPFGMHQPEPDGKGPGALIGLGAAGTLHPAAFGRCPHPPGNTIRPDTHCIAISSFLLAADARQLGRPGGRPAAAGAPA